ncbi:MAG: DUF1491 family protein [Rhodovibrionaceae bacterium]|nr:DUF1491 family protein [Rhodovibrionaceae bacterium]
MDDRIPTHLWVGAHLRQLSIDAVPAAVLRKGERTGGLVVLKLNMLESGCRVLTQTRDLDGNLAWLPAMGGEAVSESAADDYIERAVKRDPDLWVLEVEDRSGHNPFEGKIL